MKNLGKNLEINSVELDKFTFASHQIIDEGIDYAYIAEANRYRLKVYILGENLKRYSRHTEYPDGWWQAVKDRWLPYRLRKRWPVRKKVFNLDIDIVALYPELSARLSLPEEDHCLILQKVAREEVLSR